MTKEQLLELGLNEDQIKEVFRLNGIALTTTQNDLSKTQSDLAAKEAEVTALSGQLDTANKQINSFEKLNVEDIKQEVADYKQKYEEAKSQREKEVSDLKFEYKVNNIISDEKGKNPRAIKALLDLDEIKEAKDTEKAIKDAVAKIKETDVYMFETVKLPGTGGSLGNGKKNDADPEEENFGKKLAQQFKSKDNLDTSAYEL